MNREPYAFFLLKYYHIYYINYKDPVNGDRFSTPAEEYYLHYFNSHFTKGGNLILEIRDDLDGMHYTGTRYPLYTQAPYE